MGDTTEGVAVTDLSRVGHSDLRSETFSDVGRLGVPAKVPGVPAPEMTVIAIMAGIHPLGTGTVDAFAGEGVDVCRFTAQSERPVPAGDVCVRPQPAFPDVLVSDVGLEVGEWFAVHRLGARWVAAVPPPHVVSPAPGPGECAAVLAPVD